MFFDEGDALFGKRVDTSQADDKNTHYSNQDVAFLLQRIEEFSGLVIISTNLRGNMDAAFARRFEMMVIFDMLPAEQRIKFLEDNFPKDLSRSENFNFKLLVDNHSGATPGQFINVILRITKLCKARGETEIKYAEFDRMMMDEKVK